MKKLYFLALTLLLVSSVAWAQTNPPTVTYPVGFPSPIPVVSGPQAPFLGGVFDFFSATDATSVENRYSQGIFRSTVDDYIDVLEFDPNIGTFFFLGGFPEGELGYDVINFGAAHTFNFGYLGIYYRGHLVNAEGHSVTTFARPGDLSLGLAGNLPAGAADFVEKSSERTWENRLALIYGTENIGAFRFDTIFSSYTYISSREGDNLAGNTNLNQSIRGAGIGPEPRRAFALTWGGMEFAGLNPYITVGYQLPQRIRWSQDVNHTSDPANPNVRTNEHKVSQGSILGVQAGAIHDATGLWGDLVFARTGGVTETLDWHEFDGTAPVARTWERSTGNTIAGGLRAGYLQTFDAGKVSFGFQPTMQVGIRRFNNSETRTDSRPGFNNVDYDGWSSRDFEFSAELDAGLKFQANSVIALYTGTSIRLFEYFSRKHTGGSYHKLHADNTSYIDTRVENKWWTFNGFEWLVPEVKLGMTVTPNENLVIGAGISNITNRLFKADMAEMSVESGEWFDMADHDNALNQFLHMFNDIRFDLTVSFRM
ncbi:MAG: hypothetical protein FWD87_07745 [Spirochaetaceae bacterium]|nr:hypothetical protein [Spirochaetaceae bacterium]